MTTWPVFSIVTTLRFLAALRQRLAQFGLELAEEKTRLIEFGRYAARDRHQRGDLKPDTFEFLGFTHICASTKTGRFKLKRVTSKKKMRAKLTSVKTEMRRRMPHPIPDQGRWLASVLGGQYRYYAVPDNIDALQAFRAGVVLNWQRSLSRRSQKGRVAWSDMWRIADRWLPQPRILHPWPDRRFDARTERGAQCVKRARWDLRGGRRATGVPTGAPGMTSSSGVQVPRGGDDTNHKPRATASS